MWQIRPSVIQSISFKILRSQVEIDSWLSIWRQFHLPSDGMKRTLSKWNWGCCFLPKLVVHTGVVQGNLCFRARKSYPGNPWLSIYNRTKLFENLMKALQSVTVNGVWSRISTTILSIFCANRWRGGPQSEFISRALLPIQLTTVAHDWLEWMSAIK